MNCVFLSDINIIAVLLSSFIFFFIGSLWFSVIFGNMWRHELERHHVTIKKPSQQVLFTKMLLTFGANVLASIAMASLVNLTGSTDASTGLCLGIITAFGFAATSVGSVFIWENRSVKLFLLDVGYPVVGIIATALFLSTWH